jgi:hypothetical protein
MPIHPAKIPMWQLMSAPIAPEDLDFDLDPDATCIMHEFEVAWKKFMKDHPELVPEGHREKNIKHLQRLARELRKTQMAATEELQKQLDFFEKSKEEMEIGFAKEVGEAREQQRAIHDTLQSQRDGISVAEYLLSQAIPCEHFLSSLDEAAESARHELDKYSLEMSDHDNTIKPSVRGLFLVDKTKGGIRDIALRAYRLDHALLQTQVTMLQKEAEGYEKMLESRAVIGKFLKEYSQGGSSKASAGTNKDEANAKAETEAEPQIEAQTDKTQEETKAESNNEAKVESNLDP